MSREERDRLLDEGIKLSLHFLKSCGEFYPFAIAACIDGTVAHVQVSMHEEHPTSDRVIEVLVDGLAEPARRRDYTAVAIVSDILLHPRKGVASMEAIRVQLEDGDDPPVTCYVPYTRSDADVTVGEVFAEAASPLVFR